MEQAVRSSSTLVQLNERNLYGFMFGGVILRRGYETASMDYINGRRKVYRACNEPLPQVTLPLKTV